MITRVRNSISMVMLLVAIGFRLQAQEAKKENLKVAVFIYPGVELLDFAGPLEVFSNVKSFDVFTVAPREEMLTAMNKNIKLIPNYSIANCPQPDIILLPGANTDGLMPVYNDTTVINWIRQVHKNTTYTMSVCTGAAFLSKAGILDDHSFTTHWAAVDYLQTETPKGKAMKGTRYVEDGKLLTTAGVSAGLDGALYLVSKIKGKEEALTVARLIEYDKWNPDAGYVVGQTVKKQSEKKSEVKKEIKKNTTTVSKQEAIDPVCKMSVSKSGSITTIHQDKPYFFCSEFCKDSFIKAPEKYMASK